MTNNEQSTIEYKDMAGDLVYDFLKAQETDKIKVLGATILDNKPYTFESPRQIIFVKVEIDGKEKLYTYNYLKMKRAIEKGQTP